MHLRESFYEATAQVLPILLLVLAVGEIRWRAGSNLFDFAPPLIAVALMVLAEFFALGVLAGGSDSPVIAWVVIMGLVAGFTHLVIEFAGLLLKDIENKKPRPWRGPVLDLASFAIVGAAVVVGGMFLFLQYD